MPRTGWLTHDARVVAAGDVARRGRSARRAAPMPAAKSQCASEAGARAARRRPRARRARPRRARARTAWARRSCRCSGPRPPCPDRRRRPRTRSAAIVNGVPASRGPPRTARSRAPARASRPSARAGCCTSCAPAPGRPTPRRWRGRRCRRPSTSTSAQQRHVGAHRGHRRCAASAARPRCSARSRRRSRPSAGRGSAGRPCRASSGRRTRAASNGPVSASAPSSSGDDHVRAGCDRLVAALVVAAVAGASTISSSLKPGPAGLVSPWIRRTRSAR